MKQFLLYLLYVGILFVIQILVLLVLGHTDQTVANDFRVTFYLFYYLPAGIIWGILMQLGLDAGWLLLIFLVGLIALAYALVIGTVLWVITFIVRRLRDNGLKT